MESNLDLLGLLVSTALSEENSNNKSKKRKFEPSRFNDSNKKQNVSKEVKRWCLCEHFCCSIDLNYFADNEFINCLKLIGFDHINVASKSKWAMIRHEIGKQIGRPRRLSNHFLKTERQKLEQYRQTVRLSHSEGNRINFDEFMFQPTEPLRVEDRVQLYVTKSQEFHDGTILSIIRSSNPMESSQYLVQCDESSEGSSHVPPMLVLDTYLTALTGNKKSTLSSNASPKGSAQFEANFTMPLKKFGGSPLSRSAIEDMMTSNILTQKPDEESSLLPFREMGPSNFVSHLYQEDSLPLHGMFSQRSHQSATLSPGKYDEDEVKVLPSQSSWLDHTSAFEASQWSMASGAGPASLLQTVASSRPPAGARSTMISSEDPLDRVWRESERVSGRIFEESFIQCEKATSGKSPIAVGIKDNATTSNDIVESQIVSFQKALQVMKGNQQLRDMLVKCLTGLMMVGHKDVANYHKDIKMKYWTEKLSYCDHKEKEMLQSSYADAANSLKLLW